VLQTRLRAAVPDLLTVALARLGSAEDAARPPRPGPRAP
jgi:hypothetical protein